MPFIWMNCAFEASSVGAKYTRFVLAWACREERA